MAARRALRILIVDDDDADGMVIEVALEGGPVPPVTTRVADGREALDYLRRQGPYAAAQRPDLVLLDLNAPRLSLELLAEVKADPDLEGIPVVVLSASDDVAEMRAGYARHANAYVTKPFDIPSFVQVVRAINRFYTDVAALPADPE